jgi:hypothetical protein
MTNYTDFQFFADEKIPDQIADLRSVTVRARSPNSAANVWMRVTGIARFDTDPDWEKPYGWHRGIVAITIASLPFSTGDALTESAATGTFRVLDRDELDEPNASEKDNFGIAIDSVGSVSLSGGNVLNVTYQVAYKSDCWLTSVGFGLDLMIYRPAFDTFGGPPPPDAPPWALAAAIRGAFADAFRNYGP